MPIKGEIMAINPQSNTKKATSKKKPIQKEKTIYTESFTAPYYEYKDMHTREIVKTDRKWALKKAKELIEFSKLPTSKRLETFWTMCGVTYEVADTLYDIYEELKDAKLIAKEIMGDRRLTNGLEKKWDPGLVQFTQHQYHPDWKAAEEYHDARKTKIAADSSGNPGNTEIHVHMDQIPRSDLVPEKPKDTNE